MAFGQWDSRPSKISLGFPPTLLHRTRKAVCRRYFFSNTRFKIGWTLELFLLDEPTRHDSSCLCEVVALTLERVMRIAAATGRTPPHTVVVATDNTVRECKNRYFLLYMANLTSHHKLRASALVNLRKAHSHSEIDQLWGLISRRIASCDKLYSPKTVMEKITEELNRPALRSWIGLGCEIHCQSLDSVRAWKSHFFDVQRASYAGGLLDDSTANHFFLFMLRRGPLV